MVLSLDPASKITGYCAADVTNAGGAVIADAGRLTAPANWPAKRRVRAIGQDAADLVVEHEPAIVLIEIPSGKAGTGSKRGARSSLAVYGMAAGYVAAACVFEMARLGRDAKAVQLYTEREWLAPGSGWCRKENRQAVVIATWPTMRKALEADTGMDCSDACALLLWWARNRMMKAEG